ncbi:Spy/CpxP family protein refolding chaperone [uncultured Brachyspira sp.]|uniref:Spy/CpxP family protein refolding chaperone n=1 Tax=uncultured Brachyspira sp. TaxID=221953 RepID=UPI0025F3805A|nr:periplasmic heavy metal sensor [uncultured Brachyspira sp.]
MRKNIIIFISALIMIFASMSLFGQYGRNYDAGYGREYGRCYGYNDVYGRGYHREGYREGHRGGYREGHRGYHRERYRGYNRGYSYHNNTLTQEQIDEVRSIEDKYFPQMDTLRREIYNQTQNINAEMRKETPNQDAINNAIDLRSKAQADLQKLKTQCFLEIDKIYKNK